MSEPTIVQVDVVAQAAAPSAAAVDAAAQVVQS